MDTQTLNSMRACLSPSERQKVQKIQVERTMSEGYDRKKKKNGGDLDLFALFSDIQYSRAGTKSQLGGEVIGGHPIYSAFKTNSLVHTVQRQMEIMYHRSKDDSPIECKCYNKILAQKLRVKLPYFKEIIFKPFSVVIHDNELSTIPRPIDVPQSTFKDLNPIIF